MTEVYKGFTEIRRFITFAEIKGRFTKLQESPKPVHAKIQGVIIGLLDKACGSKENRYHFALALGMKAHSKDWTPAEWYAVSQICKVDKVGSKWESTEPNFQAIVDTVMRNIVEQEGQIEMNISEKPRRPADEIIKELYG